MLCRISHTPERVTREALANIVITKPKGKRVAERLRIDMKPFWTFKVFSEDIFAEHVQEGVSGNTLLEVMLWPWLCSCPAV